MQPRGKCAKPVLQAACPCSGTPGAGMYPEWGRELVCMHARFYPSTSAQCTEHWEGRPGARQDRKKMPRAASAGPTLVPVAP